MAAGKYNIRIDQGSDFSIQLTVKESGSAKNLTGYSARAQLRNLTNLFCAEKGRGADLPKVSRTGVASRDDLATR